MLGGDSWTMDDVRWTMDEVYDGRWKRSESAAEFSETGVKGSKITNYELRITIYDLDASTLRAGEQSDSVAGGKAVGQKRSFCPKGSALMGRR